MRHKRPRGYYNGKPVTGEGYQDITDSSLTQENGLWVWRLTLNGAVPASMPANIYMEWDLMVDSDNNTKTGWTSANLWNDIGVDYYFKYMFYTYGSAEEESHS